MATVLLLALTLAVGGILGSWFVSMSRSEIGKQEKRLIELTNCTAALDIVTVTCNISSDQLRITIHNIASDMVLYDFSTFAFINNNPYTNNTGGPNASFPLSPGNQYILTYGCGNTDCPSNATIGKVRVSPGNCPKGWIEIDAGITCIS